MPTLKVLVATARTQRRRASDFHYTDGAELVELATTCTSHRGDLDGPCGCSRAFTGLASRRGTTTAEVACRELTPEQYRGAFHTSLADVSFPDTVGARQKAVDAAEELLRIARSWPVGTVIERRGDTLSVRAGETPPPAWTDREPRDAIPRNRGRTVLAAGPPCPGSYPSCPLEATVGIDPLSVPSYPRMFSLADYRRSYVLYDDVECNIPRWGRDGEVGVWNYARGVLVETSRALHGTPVSLHYRELLTRRPHEDPANVPAHLPVGHEIIAVIRASDGELVTVADHRETTPYGPRGDLWTLTVNGVQPEGGLAVHPPSLPWMANIVRWHLHAGKVGQAQVAGSRSGRRTLAEPGGSAR